MNYWLMKSEPNTYSIDDLAKEPGKTGIWEGVRNYQARNYLRAMKRGDQAFFYHSSCKIPGIVGLMEIVEESTPDITAVDPNSAYFDPKSSTSHPRWVMVRVRLIEKLKTLIPLTSLKILPELKHFKLLQPGNRLSVLPVSAKEWQAISSLTLEEK